MKIKYIILTIGLFAASAALAQDSDSYCKYANESGKAEGYRLETPSAVAGVTQPNTGTAPQVYSGLTGSLSDYHKGLLTIRAAKQACELYNRTSDAQQVINYAVAMLEQQALQHRIGLDSAALQRINSLIEMNAEMIAAQSSTKLSLYALQTAKARLSQDRSASQRVLASKFIPDLPEAPLAALVVLKQQSEQENQDAANRIARQQNWDVRWETGYHRTVNNSGSGLVSPDGAYAGVTVMYNLGSRRVNQHANAASKAYVDWKHEEANDVVQQAEQLRQQLVDAIRVEDRRLSELRSQQNSLDANTALVQDASTSAGVTFANQLAADRLSLGVDVKDSEFRLSLYREYLKANFETASAKPTSIAITFDDGFESAYRNALPILDRAGVKATWFIITKALGHTGYMTPDEVKALAADGQEIGSHTQTHPHLPTLTLEQQEKEIGGSVQDLLAMGIHVKSFAYPYGQHNSDSFTALQMAGIETARTTNAGESGQNPYLLQGFSVVPETTMEDFEHQFAAAQSQGKRLIITFHRIDEDGNAISASSKLLEQIVAYIQQHHILTNTVSER